MLKAFSLPPFEPIQQTLVEALTYKTLVLVALALGACRGELIALRRDRNFICPAADWSFVLLYSDPSFMPKTARDRLPTEPYKLKALPQTVPPREESSLVSSQGLEGLPVSHGGSDFN